MAISRNVLSVLLLIFMSRVLLNIVRISETEKSVCFFKDRSGLPHLYDTANSTYE